jgi:uncharacterized membrane protein
MWSMLMHLFEHGQYGESAGPTTINSKSALEIVCRRYASGELMKEQYHDMRGTLERGVGESVSLPRQEHS